MNVLLSKQSAEFRITPSRLGRGLDVTVNLHPEDSDILLAVCATPRFAYRLQAWFKRVDLDYLNHGRRLTAPKQNLKTDYIIK